MLKHLLLTTSVAATTLLVSAGQVLAGAFFIDTFNTSTVGPIGDSGNALTPPVGTQRSLNQDIILGGAPPGTVPAPRPTFPVIPRTGPDPYLRTGQPVESTIGGTRLLNHELLLNPANSSTATRARVLNSGVLSVSNAASADSRAKLNWDANSVTGLAATGQNTFLTKLGLPVERGAFELKFNGIVGGPIAATINVVTGTTGMMHMASLTESIATAGTTSPDLFNFTDFLALNPMLDFNDVKYIELVLDGPTGFALELDHFRVFEIPEPSAVLGSIFALGLGLGASKRRKEG